MPTTFSQARSRSAGPAKPRSSATVSTLDCTANPHGAWSLAMSIPICSPACHNPLPAWRGRWLQRNPAANSSAFSVRASTANTSRQPADHRPPVYSSTAEAPQRTGSGIPNVWRAAACPSNCNVVTKPGRQRALSLRSCIRRVYTCGELQGNPSSSMVNKYFCARARPASPCAHLGIHARMESKCGTSRLIHAWLALKTNQYFHRGRERCRRRPQAARGYRSFHFACRVTQVGPLNSDAASMPFPRHHRMAALAASKMFAQLGPAPT